MRTRFSVTTASSNRMLATPESVKAALFVTDSSLDDAINRQLLAASDHIARQLGVTPDQKGRVTLARETCNETWRLGAGARRSITLGRTPVQNVISVNENGVVCFRLSSGDDAAIAALETTLASAAGPDGAGFSSSHVGMEINIAGAGADGAALTTTVASVISPTEIELASPASNTVAGAAFTIENPAFSYEVNARSGLLFRLAGGVRTAFTANTTIVIDYDAGWTPPPAADRDLPSDLEEAAIMIASRAVSEETGDSDNIRSESFPGIGSWTYETSSREMSNQNIARDIEAKIAPYRHLSV